VPSGIHLVEAPEVVEMHEAPAMAVRRKKRASIVVAMEQVRDGQADAVVSAGHTGAAMGAALLRLGRVPGVDRPAIAVVLPTLADHPVVLLDVGANVDCRPDHLLQFAVMGSVYAKRVLGLPSPHVGILSNGAEEGKGSDLTLRTTALLRTAGLNFIGNVEARDVLGGAADVVVCDGFVGNVVLKFGEGVALAFREFLKAEFRGWQGRLQMVFLVPLAGKLRRIYRRIDYREYGGAPLLGIEGVCIIAHGSSNALAIRNAIQAAVQAVRHGFVEELRAEMPRWSEPATTGADPSGGRP
jgi:glycerol-3-phosphate acyltransferase PlsX